MKETLRDYQQLYFFQRFLSHFPLQMSGQYRENRVMQMLSDLVLMNVANRKVESLTPSEYRRVVIGAQMIKDPSRFH